MADDRARILDRIRKCLRLAASDNPNEAAAALRQAQALMREHGFTADDVALSEVRQDSRATGAGRTPPNWLVALMLLVSDITGATPISSPEWRASRWHGRVTFVGVGPRAEIAAYAFEVLLRQLQAERRHVLKVNKRLKRPSRIRRADVYCRAWIEGARKHVVAIVPPSEERALVERWMEGQDLVTRTGRSRGFRSGDAQAWMAGLRGGAEARLHHGVGAREAPRRLGHG